MYGYLQLIYLGTSIRCTNRAGEVPDLLGCVL